MSFSIDKPDNVKANISTSIDEGNSSISISLTELSYYDLEKIKSIVPSIQISKSASISDNSKNIDLSTIPTEALKYTVTAGNGETRDYTVNITHKLKKFISKWNLGANQQIKLPIYDGGDYDFTVDWGDGTKQTVTSHTKASHGYQTGGDKTITITGKIEGFNFGKVPGSKDKILEISDWGDLKLGNSISYTYTYRVSQDQNQTNPRTETVTMIAGCFQECYNLVTLPAEAPNLEEVTNMSSMFSRAEKFNSDISKWDVSKVTNMSQMFSGATKFNSDISKWNVSKVTNMSSMFSSATKFNSDISKWDVSKVTNMSQMFSGAIAFNQDIGSWNVSNVTDMIGMFNYAIVFNQNIGSWNVSNVTNMLSMFSNATAFNQNLSSWNVPSSTSMEYMFRNSGMPYSDSDSNTANSRHPNLNQHEYQDLNNIN
ncbi:BspA family leucine-rich repeat surface protein [Ichthyobacterium seriolicida]|uniref:PKD domain-containing protein n=1 Tax=Ichthyobacterium seriolicida TaxID=242600 RepID=A0A1J1E8D6_9FLAO|nr:BspA family leucine-rich repeat surface protein [Ichthyobacterium seriolicida]BAV94195.1 hypothetical protein JBKA6_0182 [Ichthyobacterium seriolicida]